MSIQEETQSALATVLKRSIALKQFDLHVSNHAFERAQERLGFDESDFIRWLQETRAEWRQVDCNYLKEYGVNVSRGGAIYYIAPCGSEIVTLICSEDGQAIKTLMPFEDKLFGNSLNIEVARPAYEWPCTFAEYCDDTSHWSRSMLEDFRYSRRYAHAKHIAKSLPSEPGSDEMKFGTATHICVLEPERIEQTIRVIPKEVLAKKAGELSDEGAKNGTAWKDYAAAHAGFCLMKKAEFDDLKRVVDAVWNNPRARSLLELPGPTEYTIRWDDEFTSLPSKCRMDKKISGAIIDLKTCPDSAPGPFARKCAELGYHRQAAFYQDGFVTAAGEPAAFVFIAVSKEPPHDVACIEIHPDDIELGRRQNREALSQLAACFASGDWGNPHESQITTVRLPQYAQYQDAWRTTE